MIRSGTRIFEAEPSNHLSALVRFGGFLGIGILLQWKSNKYGSICTAECFYAAGDHMGAKHYETASDGRELDIQSGHLKHRARDRAERRLICKESMSAWNLPRC